MAVLAISVCDACQSRSKPAHSARDRHTKQNVLDCRLNPSSEIFWFMMYLELEDHSPKSQQVHICYVSAAGKIKSFFLRADKPTDKRAALPH